MLYKEIFLVIILLSTFSIPNQISTEVSTGFCSDEGSGSHLNCDVFNDN